MEDTTIEDVLKTFEDFYVQKDYHNALLTLQNKGSQLSPELYHYNIGMIYGRLENWPMARFHLLKAEKLGLVREELLQNLSLVEEKLDVQRLEMPLNIQDYFYKGALVASEGFLTTLSFMLLLVGILVLKKRPNYRKGFLVLLVVISPLILNEWIHTWPQGVSLKKEEILEGPSKIFAPVGEIPPGIYVIIKNEGEWRRIIYPSRFSGWVSKAAVQQLE